MKKFDFVIGNPPYQETAEGTSDKPIYNHFMDAAYEISDRVEMISPARFLFNAGKTPKDWNEKMLKDSHFKVQYYEQVSGKVFSGTDIKGGVAITYHDNFKDFGAIEVFSHFEELRSIRKKVVSRNDFHPLSDLVFAPESYKFTEQVHIDYPYIRYKEGENPGILSKGHDFDIVTNIFSKLPMVFLDNKPNDNDEYGCFVGLIGNKRYFKWVKKKYIRTHPNFEKYKIILPKSNGSGALGEVLSTPLIGEPLIGHTQTFISIGAFDTKQEANAAIKYIKTKFARSMLGVLKITQDNKKDTWRFVPIQEFTSISDIDWAKSISEIDQQLYRKYELSGDEINFIETHVQEMK
jgi:restriction endonuclease related protein